MTAAQKRAVEALRADVMRLDVRSRGGRRLMKLWEVTELLDGRVVVESCCGWNGHPFDDIKRTVFVGPRGGLSGFGQTGNGRAPRTKTCKGPELLYALNARRANT